MTTLQHKGDSLLRRDQLLAVFPVLDLHVLPLHWFSLNHNASRLLFHSTNPLSTSELPANM
jgi:hypothetical protein